MRSSFGVITTSPGCWTANSAEPCGHPIGSGAGLLLRPPSTIAASGRDDTRSSCLGLGHSGGNAVQLIVRLR